MTKKTRTILFFLCVFGFLVLAPVIVLYSQGYRLDLKNRRFARTGAIYFKVLPKSVDVFVDGKLAKRTDFLFGSAFVENLLPGNYLVEAKKNGYETWKKNLEVKEMRATEAKAIILFPENANLKMASTNVDDFFPSLTGKTAVLKKKDSQGWYLTVFDFDSSVEKILAREKDFLKNGTASFLKLWWSSDSKKVIVQTEIAEKEKYFLLDAETVRGSVGLDFLGSFEKLDFDPQNNQKFFVLKKGSLFSGEFSLPSQALTEIAPDVLDFSFSNGSLYFLDKKGRVYRINNLNNPSPQRIGDNPFLIKPEVFYALKVIAGKLFLQEQDGLAYFDEKTSGFVEIAKTAVDFQVSPDNEKVAYFDGGEIWIYFLKENLEQPPRQIGEKILLTRFSEKIDRIFWLNDNYLVFAVGNNIKISETDNRDQLNLTDLGEFKNPRLFFFKENKKASVLTEGKLFVSDNLLPY